MRKVLTVSNHKKAFFEDNRKERFRECNDFFPKIESKKGSLLDKGSVCLIILFQTSDLLFCQHIKEKSVKTSGKPSDFCAEKVISRKIKD